MIDRKCWRAMRAEDNNFIVEDTEEDAGDDYEVSEDGVNIAEISEGEDEEICEVGENYKDEEIEEQEIEDLIENASSAFPGICGEDVDNESVVVMEEKGEGKSWLDGEKETSMEIFELQEKENVEISKLDENNVEEKRMISVELDEVDEDYKNISFDTGNRSFKNESHAFEHGAVVFPGKPIRDLQRLGKDQLLERTEKSFEKGKPLIQLLLRHFDEDNFSFVKEVEKKRFEGKSQKIKKAAGSVGNILEKKDSCTFKMETVYFEEVNIHPEKEAKGGSKEVKREAEKEGFAKDSLSCKRGNGICERHAQKFDERRISSDRVGLSWRRKRNTFDQNDESVYEEERKNLQNENLHLQSRSLKLEKRSFKCNENCDFGNSLSSFPENPADYLRIKDELIEKPRRSFEKSEPVIQISIQYSDEKNVCSSKEAEKVESFPETINNLGKKDASRLKKETVDHGERIVGPGKESTTFENKSESYEEKRISFENKGTFVDGNEYLKEVRTGNCYFPSEMFKREITRFTGNKSLDDEDVKLLEKKKKLPWKQRRLRIRELKKNREIKMEILKNRLNTLKRKGFTSLK